MQKHDSENKYSLFVPWNEWDQKYVIISEFPSLKLLLMYGIMKGHFHLPVKAFFVSHNEIIIRDLSWFSEEQFKLDRFFIELIDLEILSEIILEVHLATRG